MTNSPDGSRSRLAEFDGRVPYLSRLRNVGEHFDDYTLGRGRDQRVRRGQLQTWALGKDEGGQLTWHWLGEELRPEAAHAAATALYRGFLADTDDYFAVDRSDSCRAWSSR